MLASNNEDGTKTYIQTDKNDDFYSASFLIVHYYSLIANTQIIKYSLSDASKVD